jgi:hypothetical protein
MDRTKFFKKVVVNGIPEVDFLWNNLSKFEKNHTSGYYRVQGDDVGQPDLISKRVYNTERYWWIICLVNQVQNPFTDIIEGDIFEIPNVKDIYDFYQNYVVR